MATKAKTKFNGGNFVEKYNWKTTEVCVTEEQIRRASPQDSEKCPWAIAIRSKLRENGIRNLKLDVTQDDIIFEEKTNSQNYAAVEVPKKVAKFVDTIDDETKGKKAVKPMCANLVLPYKKD